MEGECPAPPRPQLHISQVLCAWGRGVVAMRVEVERRETQGLLMDVFPFLALSPHPPPLGASVLPKLPKLREKGCFAAREAAARSSQAREVLNKSRSLRPRSDLKGKPPAHKLLRLSRKVGNGVCCLQWRRIGAGFLKSQGSHQQGLLLPQPLLGDPLSV